VRWVMGSCFWIASEWGLLARENQPCGLKVRTFSPTPQTTSREGWGLKFEPITSGQWFAYIMKLAQLFKRGVVCKASRWLNTRGWDAQRAQSTRKGCVLPPHLVLLLYQFHWLFQSCFLLW
jgi:hypothetical protein